MKRRRIFFFNRFYWPDESATAQILTALAEGLAAAGHDICIVTSRLNYGDPSRSYPAREERAGVRIERLWSTRFGRGRVIGRLLDYLSIYASFLAFILRQPQAGDVVVMKTDPPLLSVLGAVAVALRDVRQVAWCQDLFPEVAEAEMAVPPLLRPAFGCLRLLRDHSLRHSARVVVLGSDMADYLATGHCPPERMAILPNWAVQDEAPPPPGATAALRQRWGLPAEAFVVGYSGNLGRAHDWSTLLAAAEALRDDPTFTFLCCGGGHGYERLRAAVAAGGLEARFRFLPYQERSDLAASLRVPDVHWLTLKARLTPFIFPSKFYGILQAGRPLIFIGEPRSEMAALIREHGLGGVVPEGDGPGLAALLRHLRADGPRLAQRGQAARRLWEARFQREAILERWADLLRTV